MTVRKFEIRCGRCLRKTTIEFDWPDGVPLPKPNELNAWCVECSRAALSTPSAKDTPAHAGPRDIVLMLTPEKWAHYPYLPVKRRVTTGAVAIVETGIMIDGCLNKVYMRGLPANYKDAPLKDPNTPYRFYPDGIEAILRAGWLPQ